MVISRPIIIDAMIALIKEGSLCTIRIKAIETTSLSATGSRKAPNLEDKSYSLATHPSNQSVNADRMKTIAAIGLALSIGEKNKVAKELLKKVISFQVTR